MSGGENPVIVLFVEEDTDGCLDYKEHGASYIEEISFAPEVELLDHHIEVAQDTDA